jgi:hypothetical protein
MIGDDQAMLSGEILGDEKIIHSVLIEWGMDRAAIRRILREHRARQAREGQLLSDPAMMSRPPLEPSDQTGAAYHEN